VTHDDPQQIREAFLSRHRARYGHAGTGQPVEVVNLRVVALREGPLPRFAGVRRTARAPRHRRPITLGGERLTASVWALDELAPGLTLDGPAVLAGRDATALIEPGWRGTVHPSGALIAERA
jgi:N-methylhydantoinase A